jgi:hypothetical protein
MDQTIIGECAKRLPDRCPANAKLSRKPRLSRESLALSKNAVEDGTAKLELNLLPGPDDLSGREGLLGRGQLPGSSDRPEDVPRLRPESSVTQTGIWQRLTHVEQHRQLRLH